MVALRINKILAPLLFIFIVFFGVFFVLRPLWAHREHTLRQENSLRSLSEKMRLANGQSGYYDQVLEHLYNENLRLAQPNLKMSELQVLTNVGRLKLINVKPADFDEKSIEMTLHGSYSDALRYVQKQLSFFGNLHLEKFYAQRDVGLGRFTIIWSVDDEAA